MRLLPRAAPMTVRVSVRSALGPLLLLSALVLGCGGDDDDPGAIRVSVATEGALPDPDGYTATVGGHSADVPVNGAVTIADLSPGPYAVTLSGFAPNCVVTGGNPVDLTLQGGGHASAAFHLSCPAPAPVVLNVTTSGAEYDPDGFLVSLAGHAPQRVAANGISTLTSPSTGPLSITLSDLAPECAASGANTKVAMVSFEDVAVIPLLVRCGIGTGTLHVLVAGDDLVGDERGIWLDGHFYLLDSTGAVTVTGLKPGPYAVYVYGCDIVGGSPHMETVTTGLTTEVALTATNCSTFWF